MGRCTERIEDRELNIRSKRGRQKTSTRDKGIRERGIEGVERGREWTEESEKIKGRRE